DADEITCGTDPLLASSKPLDTDSDGTPNCIDTDDDNDGYLDENDAFPLDAKEWLDTDADGIGNNADTDDDNDGQLDTDEIACGSDPLLATSMSLDTDGDSVPDCVDTDDDNDGVIDTADAFPLDPAEWADTDADGIGNNADLDDDNDGQSDYNELVCGSDPLDQYSKSSDIDSDSIPDCVDEDKDGDGVLNDQDAFPEDSSESVDTDGDGLGDNFEVDDDNDGYLDTNDAFPLDPNEWADADNDGIGDNADTDDNNDGFEDDKVFTSGVLTPGSGGLEDTWKIINIEQYPTNRVSVYDKNGNVVFTSANYKNNWRGTFNNSANPLPAGSYYYVIDLNNGEKATKGWLYITY
ncbi:MAG: gliding motility-associated C-terminal domain-containing protein, partial [Flavobacteriaceae bacterium]